jgi:glycosyltransferase involved in cell wall biosynthesis
MLCVRKALSLKQFVRFNAKRGRYKTILGIVSSPNFHIKKSASLIDLWGHCYKEPEKFIPKGKPCLLLSESDFVDPVNVVVRDRTRKFKWDLFYFTLPGRRGVRYKGISLFLDMLPILCNEFKLKIAVIVYAPGRLRLRSRHKKYIKQFRNKLTFFKTLGHRRMARVMSACRFGLFPNRLDCSPLLLTEALVRNCPVLVSDKIFGGWKYVNPETGLFFNKINIGDKLEKALSSRFNPRVNFLSHWGMVNTAKRLAQFCKTYHSYLKKYDMISLVGSERYLKKAIKKL